MKIKSLLTNNKLTILIIFILIVNLWFFYYFPHTTKEKPLVEITPVSTEGLSVKKPSPKPEVLVKAKLVPSSDPLIKLANKDLEEIKNLREDSIREHIFDAETIGLAQDVVHAAGRISYFAAKRALIERLKAKENATKIENLILSYDQGNNFPEDPVLVHLGFEALGELSREEGLERAKNIYRGLAERLSTINGDNSQSKVESARLTDIYDLTRNVLSNQFKEQELQWLDIINVLEQLKIKDNFLNHTMKEELKKSISSVVSLNTISELKELNESLDTWLSEK